MHVNWCLGESDSLALGVLMEPQWIREPEETLGTGHGPNEDAKTPLHRHLSRFVDALTLQVGMCLLMA